MSDFKVSLRCLLVAFLLFGNFSYSQFGFQKEVAKIQSYSSFDSVHAGSELKIAVKVNVDETWHINSNKPNEDFLIPTLVSFDSSEIFKIKEIYYPAGKDIKLSFSEIPINVFEGEFFVGAILSINENTLPGEYNIVFEFQYQACNDYTCLAPTSVYDTLKINIVDKQTIINEKNREIFNKLDMSYSSPMKKSEENDLSSTLEKSGLILGLIFVFLGGLALNLTPCVYPLIPITIGYFGGQSEGKTSKLALMGLLYVLGMAFTYSIVGVVTSLSGAVFGSLLQNPIVIVVIALIFVALSLSMFGVYEFQPPAKLMNMAGGAKSGLYGAFFMGLTMGIVAAPCIGPFVLGLVTLVTAKGDPFYGFIMFFSLAVGLGTPYFILALFSGKIKSLPRAGMWMEAVKHIFGIILLGMAVYFIEPLLPKNVASFLLPGYMILAGLYLIFFEKNANNVFGFKIFKYVFSIIVMAIGIYWMMPSEKQSLDWHEYSNVKFNEAISNGNPIIIDFYADWCIPCKELDALTFSKPEIIEASKEFVSLKADMTKSLSPEVEELKNKFSIVGVPTVLIIDKNGKEKERITGFIPAEEFLILLKNVQ